MNRTLATGRLWWKEGRQLWPLVSLLLALGAVLHLLFLFTPPYDSERPTLLFLALPGLYAVGAGALLVGQEKELRTLSWLSSLPISAKDIVRIKLGVGVVGLAIVWLISLLMLLLVQRLGPNPYNTPLAIGWPPSQGESVLVWPLHSLFVLVTGFAMAWRFRSSLVALLAIIPIACLPPAFASLRISFTALDPVRIVLDQPSPLTMSLCLVAFTAALLWYGWNVGLRRLAPDTSNHARRYLTAFSQSFFPHASATIHKPLTEMPALVWQFAWQNRTVLLGTGAMIVSAAILLPWSAKLPWSANSHTLVLLASLLVFLATCWLGVTTFQGDQLQQRIRFLADRGVSPRKIWLTRQILPISIVIFVVVSLAFVDVNVRSEINHFPWLALAFAAMLIIVYAASQWAGQIVRSPIVAAVLAPIFAGIAVSYAMFAISTLGSPLWLVAVTVVLPLIATWSLMSRWMDSRTDLVYWLSHGAVLFLCAVLPAIPLLIVVMTQPGMPAAATRRFAEEANRWSAFQVQPQELSLAVGTRAGESGTQTEPPDLNGDFIDVLPVADVLPSESTMQPKIVHRTISDSIQANYRNLRSQLETKPGPIMYPRAVGFLQTDAVLARLKLAGGESLDSDRERYRTAIELLTEIVKRMRLSPRLIEQEGADQIEIGLLSELKHTGARETLGAEAYSTATRMLADSQARNEARRRAIVLSWAAYNSRTRAKGGDPTVLGGCTLQRNFRHSANLQDWLVSHRKAQYASRIMMQYLEAGSQSGNEQLQAEVAAVWGVPKSFYKPISHLSSSLTSNRNSFAGEENRWGQAPGNSWFGLWEQEAAELVSGN